jgi:hypothetical protein
MIETRIRTMIDMIKRMRIDIQSVMRIEVRIYVNEKCECRTFFSSSPSSAKELLKRFSILESNLAATVASMARSQHGHTPFCTYGKEGDN